jgi:hypothetical protein
MPEIKFKIHDEGPHARSEKRKKEKLKQEKLKKDFKYLEDVPEITPEMEERYKLWFKSDRPAVVKKRSK